MRLPQGSHFFLSCCIINPQMNSFSTFFTLANIDVFIVTKKIISEKVPFFGNVFNFHKYEIEIRKTHVSTQGVSM